MIIAVLENIRKYIFLGIGRKPLNEKIKKGGDPLRVTAHAGERNEKNPRNYLPRVVVTGLTCTGLLSSSPLLSAVCCECVMTAMPGTPSA